MLRVQLRVVSSSLKELVLMAVGCNFKKLFMDDIHILEGVVACGVSLPQIVDPCMCGIPPSGLERCQN